MADQYAAAIRALIWAKIENRAPEITLSLGGWSRELTRRKTTATKPARQSDPHLSVHHIEDCWQVRLFFSGL